MKPKKISKKAKPRRNTVALKKQAADLKLAVERKRTQLRQAAFLAAFVSCARIAKAARQARIPRALHYRWMEEDPDYARAFERATPIAAGLLEDEAMRRAHEGTKRAIYYQGEKIGYEFEYSDTLLMFLLRALLPKRYGDRTAIQHSGPEGGPIDVRVAKLAEVLSIDELKSIRARLTCLAG